MLDSKTLLKSSHLLVRLFRKYTAISWHFDLPLKDAGNLLSLPIVVRAGPIDLNTHIMACWELPAKAVNHSAASSAADLKTGVSDALTIHRQAIPQSAMSQLYNYHTLDKLICFLYMKIINTCAGVYLQPDIPQGILHSSSRTGPDYS